LGSLGANNWTASKSEDTYKANAKANDKAKASHAAKAEPVSKSKVEEIFASWIRFDCTVSQQGRQQRLRAALRLG
jgi:hypothetical protein